MAGGPMSAGRLSRERITIRRKAIAKNPTTGAPQETWGDVAERLPAEVRSMNGREAVIGSVLQGISHFEITIRYRFDLLPSDQVIWLTGGNRELNIHSAEDRTGTKRWLVIHASTLAPQGAAT